jgi:hypothetical protein
MQQDPCALRQPNNYIMTCPLSLTSPPKCIQLVKRNHQLSFKTSFGSKGNLRSMGKGKPFPPITIGWVEEEDSLLCQQSLQTCEPVRLPAVECRESLPPRMMLEILSWCSGVVKLTNEVLLGMSVQWYAPTCCSFIPSSWAVVEHSTYYGNHCQYVTLGEPRANQYAQNCTTKQETWTWLCLRICHSSPTHWRGCKENWNSWLFLWCSVGSC